MNAVTIPSYAHYYYCSSMILTKFATMVILSPEEKKQMAVPGFQKFMLPVLQFCADGKEHNLQEIVEAMKLKFNISAEDASEIISSGKQTVLNNRVTWTRTYLIKAGLLKFTRRTYCCITDRGRQVLKTNPANIDVRFLKQYPEFLEFHTKRKEKQVNGAKEGLEKEPTTPDERMNEAYQEIRDSLAQQLIINLLQCPPERFEQIVVDLLVKMGYGGSWLDAARAVGQSGDEGIDGIIDEDRLGLDSIYIQAKRWQDSVGRPEIQKFVGALMGKKARKGIFITTSAFSNEAQAFARGIEYRIVLMDGKRLANLMIDYGIGVSDVSTYHIRRVDSDYFISA